MDKLSEYLPLLIILVSLVFTVMGKKKKQDVTQETTLPGKTAGKPVDERKTPQILTDSYPKTVNKKSDRQVFQKTEIKPEKGITPFSSTPAILDSEEEGNSSFSFEENDVIQAIIYSEIINRKEY